VQSHDYIVIGAGAAGCVLANRLSAAGARILLLESGGSDRHLGVRAPAAFSTLFQGSRDWNFLSEPEPALYGRRLYLPRGRMLGGSSSMNAMMYVRGHRSDYDGWAREGASGWGYDEVLPYFKRSEDNADFGEPFHGRGGELHVTNRRWLSGHWEPFLLAAEQVGIARNPDCNGAEQEGGTLIQATIRGGRRVSAADAFLRPARRRENLTVAPGAHAHRILIEQGRARGVRYERRGQVVIAHAEREVIVSAGAYGSPQLLMLSGVGPADHLREHGIEPLLDQPNVGAHLMEHPMAFLNWRCAGDDTLDDAAHPRHLLPWLVAGRGKLSSNVAEAALHWRSDPSLRGPDFQIVFGPVYYWEHGFRKTGAPALTAAPVLIAPTSRGSVRLRSSDPADHPRILNNLLSQESEVQAMLRALELVREIAARPPFAGRIGEELNPSAGVRGRRALTQWLRATCEHEYHPTCTCRIGTPETGVVDAELRVHGVEGLRVIDASVMPTINLGQHPRPDLDDRRARRGDGAVGLTTSGRLAMLPARMELRGMRRIVSRAAVAGVLVLLAGGGASASAAIFWVNTDGNSIGAANLGRSKASAVRQRLIGGVDQAYGIAAGPGNYIYWSDSYSDRISRAHLSYDKRGRLHVQVTRNFITGADHPEGVAVSGGYIYWVNHDLYGSIGRARLNGSDVNQNFVPSESSSGLNDINYACGLTVTGSYIYWADRNQNSIARASTADGSGVTQLITGLDSPCGVAVSGGQIYWANDVTGGSIGRANLDGSGVENTFITGTHGPCMLTTSGGYLYWTNGGGGTTASTLGRARLDGSGATERYVTGAHSPCGVAVNGFTFRVRHAKRR